MTAQAPYESLTSVAMVDRLIDAVAEDAFAGRESHSDETKSARADLIAALPERAPVSAGGDAVAWQYRYLCPTEGPGDWTNARPEDVEYLRGASKRYELRALGVIATPAPPVGADWVMVPRECQVLPPGWHITVQRGVVPEIIFLNIEGPKCSTGFQGGHDDLLRRIFEKLEVALAAAPTPAEARGVGDGEWRIDTSAGGPILVYENCSVIESEQAEYVLRLIAADRAALAANKPAGEVES